MHVTWRAVLLVYQHLPSCPATIEPPLHDYRQIQNQRFGIIALCIHISIFLDHSKRFCHRNVLVNALRVVTKTILMMLVYQDLIPEIAFFQIYNQQNQTELYTDVATPSETITPLI